MNERPRELIAQLQAQPPADATELASRLELLLQQCPAAANSQADPLASLRHDYLLLLCLQNNLQMQQWSMQQETTLQANLLQARERIDRETLYAGLQQIEGAVNSLAAAKADLLDQGVRHLADLRQQLDKIKAQIQQREETLARYQLQHALKACDANNQKLEELEGSAITGSRHARDAENTIGQQCQQLARQSSQLEKLYDAVLYYRNFHQWLSNVQHWQQELSRCTREIANIDFRILPDLYADELQAKQWRQEFAAIPATDAAAFRRRLFAEQTVQFVQTTAYSFADTLTGNCLALDKNYFDKPQQNKNYFLKALFERQDWTVKKERSEQELATLKERALDYQKVPIRDDIRNYAKKLGKLIEYNSDQLQSPDTLLQKIRQLSERQNQRLQRSKNKHLLAGLLLEQWQWVEQIRQDYNLTQEDDFYRQQKLVMDEADYRQSLAADCDQCQQLQEVTKQLKQYARARKALTDWQQTARHAQNGLPVATLIDSLDKVQTQINAKLKDLYQDSIAPSAAPPAQSHTPSGHALDGWRQEIEQLFGTAPQEIQHWLQQVLQTMQTMPMNPERWFQCLQSLRDIRYELQAAADTKSYTVLLAYQAVAPDPATDLNNLLILKPGIPLPGNQPLPPLRNHIALQANLDALAACRDQWRESCPHEADLLEQACYNLHYLAWQAENNPHRPLPKNLRNITDDPRYEPLRTQQGFARVWQELVKVWCRLLDFLQPGRTHHYRDSFFYRPAPTERLFDAAIEKTLAVVAH